SQLISPPPPTWMLPFGGFPLPYGSTPGITRGGKSHSGISGSKAACAYPELIAACHALRQRPSRAIRQVAYHAEPVRNPRSVRGNQQGCISPKPNSGGATGGVCKEQGRIHRAMMTRGY